MLYVPFITVIGEHKWNFAMYFWRLFCGLFVVTYFTALGSVGYYDHCNRSTGIFPPLIWICCKFFSLTAAFCSSYYLSLAFLQTVYTVEYKQYIRTARIPKSCLFNRTCHYLFINDLCLLFRFYFWIYLFNFIIWVKDIMFYI